MDNNNSTSSGGIGLGGVLVCIFITLKLCHVINWSWWWVLSPLWVGILIVVAMLLIALIIGIVCEFKIKKIRK